MVKRAIRLEKRKENEEWRRRISANFRENKIFGQKANNIRKGLICQSIKEKNGELIRENGI